MKAFLGFVTIVAVLFSATLIVSKPPDKHNPNPPAHKPPSKPPAPPHKPPHVNPPHKDPSKPKHPPTKSPNGKWNGQNNGHNWSGKEYNGKIYLHNCYKGSGWCGWSHYCWYKPWGCWMFWCPFECCWYQWFTITGSNDTIYLPCDGLTDENGLDDGD